MDKREPAGLKLLWEELVRDFAVVTLEICGVQDLNVGRNLLMWLEGSVSGHCQCGRLTPRSRGVQLVRAGYRAVVPGGFIIAW